MPDSRPEMVCQGHFAENGTRDTPTEPALDPVNQLDDFDLARENSKQRARSSLMNGPFTGFEMQVGRRLRETVKLGSASAENNGIARTSSIVNMARFHCTKGRPFTQRSETEQQSHANAHRTSCKACACPEAGTAFPESLAFSPQKPERLSPPIRGQASAWEPSRAGSRRCAG
jgi:hypothetical protein